MTVGMTELAVLRLLCLAVPTGLALVLWRRPGRRLAGAALLSFLAAFVAIGVANQLAMAVGWWRFEVREGSFLGVPLDLWIGWAVFWGPVPLLVRHRLPIWSIVLTCGWLDILVMPRLGSLVSLRSDWLYGELVALVITVVPALLLGRWTVDRRRLTARVVLQLVTFTGLTFWLLPSAVMGEADGRWSHLLEGPVWRTSLIVQLMVLAAVPAVAAVIEFAVRGEGTPYPWDPPARLVTTGPYAYLANPMQVSVVLMLTVLAWGTHSLSLAVAVVGAAAFSHFVAGPHESTELAARHEQTWWDYDWHVRAWWVRRRPYRPEAAELYLAESCTICSQTRCFIESTKPQGLTLKAAEGYDGTVAGLRRALYVGPDGLQARGLGAVARGLEHSGPGWAYVGWLLRLPVVRPLLQLLLDGMGGGARQLPTRRP